MKVDLPFRQIHLDFHTSEAIDGVGADFNPEVFAQTLEDAHVNSINIFALGHHGWIYFESEEFPDERHPHLTRNLLAEQIEALHARDIKCPLYVSVQVNAQLARRHPEWRVVTPEGKLYGPGPYEDGFWQLLCLNSPYVDRLKVFVDEVLETLPVDGFWFDIVDARDCSCYYCRKGMVEQGLEPSKVEDRMAYARQVLHRFVSGMTEFVHERNPDALIFYNAGHVGPRHRPMVDAFTHLELESLPSGGWGYLHFPIAARYARNLGKDYLGMTGKFHTSWGDFHSFKNRAALEFECFHMLALNGKVCVGDQLHPRGVLDPHTYELIGGVYEEVEAKEPWCAGAEAVTEIGVLTPEEFEAGPHRTDMDFRPMMGVTRMLQEGKHQFDVLDSESDFSPYRVLVLPDKIPVEGALADKLQAFLDSGGAVIASYASGMTPDRSGFSLAALGVELIGEGPRDPSGELVRGKEYPAHHYAEYLLPGEALAEELPQTEHVMYMRGMLVGAEEGAEVLADVVAPYFTRTYKHFCSHRQAPSSGRVDHPAIVQKGRAIYFSHPIFTQYQTKAPRWCKQLFLKALGRLLADPLVQVAAPTATIAMLNRQADDDRYVLHLLHYVPERRGEAFDVIEDVVPLHDVAVSVKVDEPVERVTLVPQGEPLAFEVEDGRVSFTVPRVEGHQMVEIGY
ncbi:MAG: beta-galactosidase trimerization domain-containing protein [Anaerolineae bacterium]